MPAKRTRRPDDLDNNYGPLIWDKPEPASDPAPTPENTPGLTDKDIADMVGHGEDKSTWV